MFQVTMYFRFNAQTRIRTFATLRGARISATKQMQARSHAFVFYRINQLS